MTNPLPLEALEADICTIAMKGAGKTYTNKANVERLLDIKRRVVILDPLHIWWGLRVNADGSVGYPVVVIGGPRADFPLDPTRGAELGEFIAQSDASYVVDVSDLVKSDLIRFATDFLTALYRTNRRALWLVLEEADVFASQNPATDGSRAMVDSVDMIVRRGRAFGFRLWSITQRPARLAKDVTSMASTLLLLRVKSPQDRAAVEDWVKGNAEKGQAAEVIASLASLETGEGYVWSPDLDLFKRVRFPTIKTIDNSATPKHGEKPKTYVMPHVDTSALEAALPVLATTVAAGARKAASSAPLVDLDAIRAEGHRKGFAAGHEAATKEITARVLSAIGHSVIETGYDDNEVPLMITSSPARLQSIGTPSAPAKAEAKPNPKGAEGLLSAAAKVFPVRLTWGQLCLIAGRKPTGGHFNASRKTALDNGWLAQTGDLVSVGIAGMTKIGTPPRDRPLVDVFAEVLPEPSRKMFSVIRANPHGISIADLANALGMKPTGGHWNTGMSILRKNGLLAETDGLLLVSPAITGRG